MTNKKVNEIAYQEHSKFKVFVGPLTKSKSIGCGSFATAWTRVISTC